MFFILLLFYEWPFSPGLFSLLYPFVNIYIFISLSHVHIHFKLLSDVMSTCTPTSASKFFTTMLPTSISSKVHSPSFKLSQICRSLPIPSQLILIIKNCCLDRFSHHFLMNMFIWSATTDSKVPRQGLVHHKSQFQVWRF